MSIVIAAAGGIVARGTGAEFELALIHRPKYDDWSFPKGKVDPGETLEETALREVWEETALHCALEYPLGVRDYPGKRVHYWAMRIERVDAFVPGAEIDALRWVTPEVAAVELTHEQDRSLLRDYLARLDLLP